MVRVGVLNRCPKRNGTKVRIPKTKTILLIFFLLWASGFAAGALSQRLIVHPGIDLTAMTVERVRAMFTMRSRRWSDGTPVRVFVLPDEDPVHRQFVKKILGVLPYRLRRAWDRAVFSGTGQAPTEVQSEAEIVDRVSTTLGAVGYASDRVGDQRVRIVPVE